MGLIKYSDKLWGGIVFKLLTYLFWLKIQITILSNMSSYLYTNKHITIVSDHNSASNSLTTKGSLKIILAARKSFPPSSGF